MEQTKAINDLIAAINLQTSRSEALRIKLNLQLRPRSIAPIVRPRQLYPAPEEPFVSLNNPEAGGSEGGEDGESRDGGGSDRGGGGRREIQSVITLEAKSVAAAAVVCITNPESH
jgi:hypothetical protein